MLREKISDLEREFGLLKEKNTQKKASKQQNLTVYDQKLKQYASQNGDAFNKIMNFNEYKYKKPQRQPVFSSGEFSSEEKL